MRGPDPGFPEGDPPRKGGLLEGTWAGGGGRKAFGVDPPECGAVPRAWSTGRAAGALWWRGSRRSALWAVSVVFLGSSVARRSRPRSAAPQLPGGPRARRRGAAWRRRSGGSHDESTRPAEVEDSCDPVLKWGCSRGVRCEGGMRPSPRELGARARHQARAVGGRTPATRETRTTAPAQEKKTARARADARSSQGPKPSGARRGESERCGREKRGPAERTRAGRSKGRLSAPGVGARGRSAISSAASAHGECSPQGGGGVKRRKAPCGRGGWFSGCGRWGRRRWARSRGSRGTGAARSTSAARARRCR